MPRKSPEARATATAQKVGKLLPSPHLAPPEKKVWRSVVEATPAGHLSERDRPLVESYVSLTVAQRKLQQLIATATAAELIADGPILKAMDRIAAIGKSLAAISNRLKIAPLALHSAAHKAGQRTEQPETPPLLGGMRRVK